MPQQGIINEERRRNVRTPKPGTGINILAYPYPYPYPILVIGKLQDRPKQW